MEVLYILPAFLVFVFSLIYFNRKLKNKNLTSSNTVTQLSGNSNKTLQIYEEEIKRLTERVTNLQNSIYSLEARLRINKDKVKDLKELNKTLNDEKINLEERLRKVETLKQNREEVLTLFVHNLRSPIFAVRKLVKLLGSFEKTIDEQNKATESILTASEQIIEIAYRISSDTAEQPKENSAKVKQASLKQILQDVYLYNIVKARDKGIKIRINVSEYLPNVKIDHMKISSVLDNLLDNAIKYSKENSEVLLTAAFKDSKMIVEIEDEGAGIAQESLDKVFEKGFMNGQVNDLNAKGLGLYISKKYIEEHNGKIYFDPDRNVGAKATFELPVSNIN